MRLIQLDPETLALSSELSRSGSAKQFEERLQSSIEEIGLAEPLKVVPHPDGGYLVIDGTMRLRAVHNIRQKDPTRFVTVAAYVLDYDQRFEIRFQSDIYQDLLPSQLATLVEHLHAAENVLKVDIARYIGVSPATLRNYTGLWRLLQRGGLFARIVELMDVGVLPSSNPYAWLRLTKDGLRLVLTEQLAKGQDPEKWITETVTVARLGGTLKYPLAYIENVTAALPEGSFRTGEDVRAIKQDLGLRRAATQAAQATKPDYGEAILYLSKIKKRTREPVLKSAAKSLQEYLA